jgi:hypothetical protein
MKFGVAVIVLFSNLATSVESRGNLVIEKRGTGDGDKNQYTFKGDFRARGSDADVLKKGLRMLNKAMNSTGTKTGHSSRKQKQYDLGEDEGYASASGNLDDSFASGNSSFESSSSSAFGNSSDGYEEVRRTVRTRQTRTVTTSGEDGTSAQGSVRKPRNGEKGYYRKYTLGVTSKQGGGASL